MDKYILEDSEPSRDLAQIISICKSNSGIQGATLRTAHYNIGQRLAPKIKAKSPCVVAFMRAGLPLAMGISDTLDAPILFLDDKYDPLFWSRNHDFLCQYQVLLVDAVIHSGRSMLQAIEASMLSPENIYIVANVIQEGCLDKLSNYHVYAARLSSNSFIGSKTIVQSGDRGPDTGDRLFLTLT